MTGRMFRYTSLMFVAALAGCATTTTSRVVQRDDWSLARTPLNRSAAELSNDTAEHLAWAKAWRDRIIEVSGDRTIKNTLVPYNEMMMHVDASLYDSELLANVHPDAEVRTVAEESGQQAQKFLTDLKLDRELYDAFVALDVSEADEETQYLVFKVLRDFRRAGVDRDEATRQQVAALNEEIVKLGQTFQRNIREGKREILLDSPAEVAGLPQDWIDNHQPDDSGKIHVTTQYPDYIPFMTYADSEDARRRLSYEFKNRGYPDNIEVLETLIAKRAELAELLGYRSWADYAIEDKMMASADNAHAFIDRIVDLSRDAAARDRQTLLERKREDNPAASQVGDWERAYYENKVKLERYAFDPQAVRPYFNFETVRQGLFDLTGRLFGIEYRQVFGLDLWHESVTAWDVYDDGNRIGRFFLDLHPRADKYSHAAQFDYRTGVEGVRLPQAALVCNFPDPRDSEDGVALMEHHQVATFFHEFGHLLHAIFAGHRKWIGTSGISTEWDFVEAPSQTLEQWCYELEPLQLFARHHQTGEPIPAESVEKLKAASEFGKGIYTARQMFLASMSLNYYDRDGDVDTTELMNALLEKYSPFPYVDDTHLQCSFTHLDHYSAFYYTYMWSLVIAKDLLSRFEAEGLLNERTAREFRKAILDPGGSKPAEELVQDFLGRPHSFDAYTNWLNRM